MNNNRNGIFIILLLLVLPGFLLFAGQTGKIAGYVTDSETGEAVIGANLILDGTYFGAAADIDGYYSITNVPPGKYTLSVSSVGYKKTKIQEVFVKIDKTTKIDVVLYSDVLELGEEIVVAAEKPLIQKDLTSSAATVSSEEIEMLPVENMQQVVNLQAGVVGGHFRGGRLGEVAYLVDGIPVTDAFNGAVAVEVENSSIRQLEVISGTFNAEYGQALSGVVNIVTKEGDRHKFHGGVSGFVGSHFSSDGELFQNADRIEALQQKNIQFNLSGPTKVLDALTFFVTGRYYEDEGFLYGKRIYNVDDSGPFAYTGDNEFVAMNPYEKKSVNSKLTYSQPSWKVSASVFYDENWNKYYDHAYRLAPDGIQNHYRVNNVYNLQFAFYPTQKTIATLKFSNNLHRYNGHLYDDPLDPRYVEPDAGIPTSNYTFRYGGNQVGRYVRETQTFLGMFALESELSKHHQVKLGAEARLHNLYDHGWSLVNLTESDENDTFTPGYRLLHTPGNQQYQKYPYEFSAFIQDKIEYDIMIINAGVRFDYFNSNTLMPADLKNPNNNPLFPGYNEQVESDAEYQFSPRLGVSFPITDQGAIYFSYGHFLQIPRFEFLYRNDEYIITESNTLSSITGNPNLKVERRVQYELGLQQVIFPNVSLDMTVYYSDIRNLLGMEIINTYGQAKYARFTNRDYGNVKGLIIALDKRFADYFSAKIDYTYQIAEGNASDPFAVYNDNQTDPPQETEKKVVPLDWDQTSTLNITANVGEPGNWTVGLVFTYGSGQPYTEDVRISNNVRFENGGVKPSTMNIDLRADKHFDIYGIDVTTFLWVYNLLDTKNEYGVYGTTGRAGRDLNTEFAGEIIGINTIDEFVNNPQMYSSPRQVRLGFSFGF